jgi:hypothetical protein
MTSRVALPVQSQTSMTAPGEVFFVEEHLAVLLSVSPGGGVDGGVGYGIEGEEGPMILSQRSRSSSAFCTKMGYISFNAAELNAGANIRLYHQPALKH